MKVVQVVEPGVDGVFRHVEGLVRILTQRGIHVSLAYSSRRGSEGLRRLVAEVERGGGATLNLDVGNKPSFSDFAAALKLRRLIRQVSPSIVHAHSSKAGGLVRMPLVVPNSIPVFYSPHAYYGMGRQPGGKRWVFDQIERSLAARGTTVNISRDEAMFARERLGVSEARQRIIHNPVQTETFVPPSLEQKRAAQAKLGLPPEAIAIGTVGRMCFQKDPETLYRAAAPLLRQRPNLYLLHLGEGELFDRLKGLCEELGIAPQVKFCGYSEEPAGFYHALDAMVMTSRYEAGWPIVILEALSCGLPVVSSRGPGTADIGSSGLSHCWTADVGDVAGFENALTSLLADLPSNRQSNHRELALSRFSPDACYGAVLAAYRGALSDADRASQSPSVEPTISR